MTTILYLGNYQIDLVKVEDFKEYFYENIDYFSPTSFNSYLKAVDIPPKFFKEQPVETQKELIENRKVFVKEHKKYFDKVIVVARVKTDLNIVNACRMVESEALKVYKALEPIEKISNKFEHRSFVKDSYITYVISDDIKKGENKVLVIDFPVTLNKPVVIHKALYSLPDETFVTPVEHIQYLTGEVINFDTEYSDIEVAIKNKSDFLIEERTCSAEKDILREPEVVALALNQSGIIPNSYIEKVGEYIKKNTKGTLTTRKLESLVLDYDETFRTYKQVTAIRGISGDFILSVLESPTFKEFIEAMENALNELKEEL